MIIDCHGHYTTEVQALTDYRKAQLEALANDPNYKPKAADFEVDENEMREKLEAAQLKLQSERGSDLTIFSPRAVGMGHHLGTEQTAYYWAQISNDMVHRAVTMYPDKFVGVCQ
ncbi:MAG: amidohydrolase, partial [Alphaproteobacteria bacterium]